MQAKDVMTTSVVTVAPDTPVAEIARLLVERHISAVPVVDGNDRVLGIVSEGDLMHRPETGGRRRHSWWLGFFASSDEMARDYAKACGRRASDVMTSKVVTVSEDTPIAEIAHLLEEHRIKRVPVMRGGRLVGIVSRADLLRAVAAAPAREQAAGSVDDRAIRERILDILRHEQWMTSAFVNVIVTDGVVHLWGTIANEDQRKALLAAADNVPGVREVVDHLGHVQPWVWGT